MRVFISLEFKRVFKSIGLWISVLLGLVLSVSHYITNVYPMREFLDTYIDAGLNTIMPHSVFVKWIGGEGSSLQHFIFFMILPLLCTIPWSMSVFNDIKDGLVKNYFIRAKKSCYFFSKYIVNFLVGGIITVIPLLANLLLTYATLPSLTPDVSTGAYAIRSGSMWAEMFYTEPYRYVFLYLSVIFVFGGVIASFSASLGIVMDNGYVVIIFPFVLHLFCYTVFSSLPLQKFAPFYFLDPLQAAPNISLTIIAAETAALLFISLCLAIKGIKKETL